MPWFTPTCYGLPPHAMVSSHMPWFTSTCHNFIPHAMVYPHKPWFHLLRRWLHPFPPSFWLVRRRYSSRESWRRRSSTSCFRFILILAGTQALLERKEQRELVERAGGYRHPTQANSRNHYTLAARGVLQTKYHTPTTLPLQRSTTPHSLHAQQHGHATPSNVGERL